MTWDSLTDRVLATFGSGVHRVKVKKYLQEAEEDFALGTKCIVKTFSFMPFNTDDFIKLPADFLEIKGNVEFKTRTLKRVSHFEDFSRFKTDGTIKQGNPEHYFIRGETMYLYPAVSNVGLISFSYVAKPVQLDSSMTNGYKRLQIDGLVSDQFYVGDVLLGRTGATQATVADVIDIQQKKATLVLHTIIVGDGNFDDNEVVVATGDEQEMWLTNFGNWNNLLANWQSIGLGGIADVNGILYDYTGAGGSPTIPESYHAYLVCYAKAALAEDSGDLKSAAVYRNKFESDKETIRVLTTRRGVDGVQTIVDVFGGSYL
tara:strand:- start:435 stop:1385 length:951 start_codon:yes stop_codon:yes gene_type:complete